MTKLAVTGNRTSVIRRDNYENNVASVCAMCTTVSKMHQGKRQLISFNHWLVVDIFVIK